MGGVIFLSYFIYFCALLQAIVIKRGPEPTRSYTDVVVPNSSICHEYISLPPRVPTSAGCRLILTITIITNHIPR